MRRGFVVLAAAVSSLTVAAVVPSVARGSSTYVPAQGERITAANARQVAGAREVAPGIWAAPLRSARPAWVTDEMIAAARKKPQPAPESANPDVPASGFVGIRPGSFEIDPYGCTMNFVFQQSGQYAIGTAGHCVDKVGQMVTLVTVAPGGDNPVLVTIGPVLKRVFSENKIAPDFALVAIPAALNDWVFPTIAQVLGPCGTYTGGGLTQIPLPEVFKGQDTAIGPEQVAHYGHGLGIGTGGTPRTGVAMYWDTDAYYWNSPSAPGDSGSPVRVSNLAGAGNLTDLVVDTAHPGAVVEGTRLTSIEQIVGGWTLVNSSYC